MLTREAPVVTTAIYVLNTHRHLGSGKTLLESAHAPGVLQPIVKASVGTVDPSDPSCQSSVLSCTFMCSMAPDTLRHLLNGVSESPYPPSPGMSPQLGAQKLMLQSSPWDQAELGLP